MPELKSKHAIHPVKKTNRELLRINARSFPSTKLLVPEK